MKKILSIVAIAAISMFAVSCGDGAAEAKRLLDSTAAAMTADSALKAEQAKHMADSTMMANTADSTAKAVEAKRLADSADAAAKAPKGTKPKPKPTTTTAPAPKVGGHR